MVFRETITWPPVRELQVLARVTGAEESKSIVLSSHASVAPVVSVQISPENLATQNQKVYKAGIIVARITKDVGGGEDEKDKWGPFDQTATDDGRDAQMCAFKQAGASDAIMRFTALRPGISGRAISIAIVDAGGASDPLTVTVTENSDGTTDISVGLETGGDTVEVSTAQEVIDKINADVEASKIIQAANGGASDGTGLAAALGAAFLTGDRPDVEIGVLAKDVNVNLGDLAAGVYVGHCVFRDSQFVGYSKNEANLDAVFAEQFCRAVTVTDLA